MEKKTNMVGLTDVEDLNAINELAFEERSLQQWNLLPSEALRLIFTDLHINARGNRPKLA